MGIWLQAANHLLPQRLGKVSFPLSKVDADSLAFPHSSPPDFPNLCFRGFGFRLGPGISSIAIVLNEVFLTCLIFCSTIFTLKIFVLGNWLMGLVILTISQKFSTSTDKCTWFRQHYIWKAGWAMITVIMF